jgi:hypothetical protein
MKKVNITLSEEQALECFEIIRQRTEYKKKCIKLVERLRRNNRRAYKRHLILNKVKLLTVRGLIVLFNNLNRILKSKKLMDKIFFYMILETKYKN